MNQRRIFVVYEENPEFGTIIVAAYFDESLAKNHADSGTDYYYETAAILG